VLWCNILQLPEPLLVDPEIVGDGPKMLFREKAINKTSPRVFRKTLSALLVLIWSFGIGTPFEHLVHVFFTQFSGLNIFVAFIMVQYCFCVENYFFPVPLSQVHFSRRGNYVAKLNGGIVTLAPRVNRPSFPITIGLHASKVASCNIN
jgi:hypothetical protein